MENDREKMIWLATAFGDNYLEKPKSIIIPNWKKRFTFNAKNEIVKIQGVHKNLSGKTVYTNIGETV